MKIESRGAKSSKNNKPEGGGKKGRKRRVNTGRVETVLSYANMQGMIWVRKKEEWKGKVARYHSRMTWDRRCCLSTCSLKGGKEERKCFRNEEFPEKEVQSKAHARSAVNRKCISATDSVDYRGPPRV